MEKKIGRFYNDEAVQFEYFPKGLFINYVLFVFYFKFTFLSNMFLKSWYFIIIPSKNIDDFQNK